ncbi:conserved Plasmodium protein, unknown function [Plasmodium knowlesi strain H]|uniref:Uncharacterized protein n=3 Tax=Plasmodium knowlesi TaxID=5850 RepID=A0A5K1V304_PLAKH|nr:conserved Plasmodium protein, unknown function [Plasmodium knowlesi strain H]OTN67538.1 Uncharacterized protein PKNOH_S06431400 [Plasmodium knowlesi]CAA9987584.1 conserved Plasmodium protein, unknown function [Plasmodium knowlesi strain H]SBO27022.1 conserved Plasmodium protein, unknown function [Plasmodium knowlesi strain H]SBO29221.1 conserved Plasmodium protein, unknown function [Plasmodium knowlesi strain H]VVS77058.1 conserved Plasmodium protein, unknown function [Plasmodium knowlesi s|eukprot:XP_002258586.1 hypothetical protein, conserved in Plasmodium species [Plasmodium knowlesi strain H]
MVKSLDLNASPYDTSNEYNGLFIGNIFSEIQDEIKNEYVTEKFEKKKISAQLGEGKGHHDEGIKGTSHFAPRGKINIDEYVNFVIDKKNEYKKKKKEYLIEYINQGKIRKFHYKDMEILFKIFYQFLDFQEKCLLCCTYLSFPHLYLKGRRERGCKGFAEKYQHKGCSSGSASTASTISEYCRPRSRHHASGVPFCECLETIGRSKQYLSEKKDDYYIDMIHLLQHNGLSFSSNVKKNIVIKEFTKNAKFTEFYKCNSVNEKCVNTLPLKGVDTVDTKYVNVCRYLEKPRLTIEHVKALNSHTENFTPLFKVHKASTLLTTVEKKLLIECLKVIKKIYVYDKIDKLTVIIFCYLSNLYNVVMRLNAECILSCYSRKHFEFFLYYFFQENPPSARRTKVLAMKVYRSGDGHDDLSEDHNC